MFFFSTIYDRASVQHSLVLILLILSWFNESDRYQVQWLCCLWIINCVLNTVPPGLELKICEDLWCGASAVKVPVKELLLQKQHIRMSASIKTCDLQLHYCQSCHYRKLININISVSQSFSVFMSWVPCRKLKFTPDLWEKRRKERDVNYGGKKCLGKREPSNAWGLNKVQNNKA